MQPAAETLLSVAYCLKKPVTYFFPEFYRSPLLPERRTPEEQELLLLLPDLEPEDITKLIAQVRAAAQVTERSQIRPQRKKSLRLKSSKTDKSRPRN